MSRNPSIKPSLPYDAIDMTTTAKVKSDSDHINYRCGEAMMQLSLLRDELEQDGRSGRACVNEIDGIMSVMRSFRERLGNRRRRT